MQKILFVLAIVAGLSPIAFGAEFKLPEPDNAYASVEIPDDWTSKPYDQGVESVSEDGEVYLAIEAAGGETLDKSIEEAMAYLKEKGVTVNDETSETTEAKLGEMDVVRTNWEGKDEDGACRVTLSIVAVSPGKGLLVIYWASPEGDEKNTEALNAIANSIKPLE